MIAATLTDLARTCPSLAGLLEAVQKAARTPSPVLLLGEAGSGRSTLARAVHRSSLRRGGPLVEVDPGAIPTTLFESDLFGYEAGAFTGAESAEAGRVERARGGTLILDHVEELPLGTQPKLLRLLAEQRFTPLGGRERAADVRFVAVGSEDLEQRIARGAFRQDLFYRLEVLSFRIPPLRERRRDLPSICDHLLAELCERFARPPMGLADRARRWMLDYDWPGNLRQVRNVLERALVMNDVGPLDPPPPKGEEADRPRSLAEVEAREIRRALAYSRGHQGRAAEILGISRKALWEKRKRHGIP